MTYGEIKHYLDTHTVNFADDFDSIPRGVQRWVTHEVLPTVVRGGDYTLPDLEALCPATQEPVRHCDA